jgi:hypothetical protein
MHPTLGRRSHHLGSTRRMHLCVFEVACCFLLVVEPLNKCFEPMHAHPKGRPAQERIQRLKTLNHVAR